MILSLLALQALAQPAPEPVPEPEPEAPAEAPAAEPDPVALPDPAAPDPEPALTPDDTLARYRMPLDALAGRAIGTTSRPVAFDWRKSPVHLAGTASMLMELNNFDSMRGGAAARFPTGGSLIELGVTYVGVWDTPSSRQLALTPYRQPGRPPRVELDFAVGLPLAEGVVTTAPRFFPAVELVFVAWAGLRYSLYPTGFAGLRAGRVIGAVLSPTLTDEELANLEDQRLAAMQVDRGRYGLTLGFGNDVYFAPGVFVSPRMTVGVPLLAPATQTDLRLWADLSLSVGVAL